MRPFRHSRTRALAIALGFTAITASPASAGTPFTLPGAGAFPHIAVTPAGTAYIAWTEKLSGDDRLRFCRLPRGATACSETATLSAPPAIAGEVYGPPVIRFSNSNPAAVSIVQTHDDLPPRVIQWTSGNSGASWSAGSEVANNMEIVDGGPTASDTGFGLVSNRSGRVHYQETPSAIGAAEMPGSNTATHNEPTAGSLGTTRLTAAQHGSTPAVRFWRYDGTGNVNDPTNWIGPGTVGAGERPRLAGGPSGLYLLSYNQGATRFEARLYNSGSSTFGAAQTVASEPSFSSITGVDLFQDGSGHLLAAWAVGGQGLRLAVSNGSGAAFGAAGDVVRGENLTHLQIAAAPDAQGFAVWDDGGSTIRAASLETLPPVEQPGSGQPGPQPPGSGSGPQPTGSGDTSPPADLLAGTKDVGGYAVNFYLPGECVPRGAKVRMRVTSKLKKKIAKGQRRKIRSVKFTLVKAKVVDKKAAFKASFDSGSLTPGTFHKASAVVTMRRIKKPRTSKRVKLKGTVQICP